MTQETVLLTVNVMSSNGLMCKDQASLKKMSVRNMDFY
jgi:hypothetical protein